jgi:membrane protein YdbS with pleckstrin-like domain
MKEVIKIGEEFKLASQFKKLYYTYLLMAIIIGILPWYVPMLLFAPQDFSAFVVTAIISALILAVLIFIGYWIPKYYDTMLYRLTGNEIVWRRGVWFKNTGIVPFNRITNIDIVQGPISRMLGIASLKIQTAGYSAPSGGSAEIRIDGIEQFEELRDLIMESVRGKKPVAVETYEEENINLKILNELVRIRELLESSSRR